MDISILGYFLINTNKISCMRWGSVYSQVKICNREMADFRKSLEKKGAGRHVRSDGVCHQIGLHRASYFAGREANQGWICRQISTSELT